jgi:hypothetical protein
VVLYSHAMRHPRKPRHATSAALLELRKRMNKTQQTFAVEVLPSAISTIARWETITPPEEEALDRLAAIAIEHGHRDLANVFVRYRVAGMKKKWAETKQNFPNLVIAPRTDTEPACGYLVQQFDGRNRLYLATATQLLDERVSAGDAKALSLLTQLVTGLQEIYKDAPIVYKLAFASVDALTGESGPLIAKPPTPSTGPTKTKSRKRRK